MDLTALTDEQLVDALAALEAQDIAERDRSYDLAASALFYAQRIGWPVFPVVARGKRPLTRHGFKDATVDEDVIRDWWATWPDANIGTPTGMDGCGFDVIDVDGRTGLASLAELKHASCPADCSAQTFCDATGDLPPVRARAFTPGTDDGPGWHLYVDPTGYGNASGYEPGMDYRGAGGYVVVPPSMGLNGKRYTWLQRPELAS